MKPNLVDYSQFIKKCENPPIRQENKKQKLSKTQIIFFI